MENLWLRMDRKTMIKTKIKKDTISGTIQTLHENVHDSVEDDNTDIKDEKLMITVMLWMVLLKEKMIP